VAGKLLRDGLIEEISARGALPFWRRDEDKGALALRITRHGLAAIGVARCELSIGCPSGPDRGS